MQHPHPHPHQQRIALTNQVLQDIHQHGTFDLGPFRIDAASEHAEISISLRLLSCNSPAPHTSDPYYGKRARQTSYASSGPGGPRAGHGGRNDVFLPISGFPRRLMAEDGIGKALLPSYQEQALRINIISKEGRKQSTDASVDLIVPLPTHSTVERQKKPPMSSRSASGSASGSMSRTTTSSSGASGGGRGGGGGGLGEGRRDSVAGEPPASPPPQVPPRNATRLSVGSINMTSPLVSPVPSHSTGGTTNMSGMAGGLDTLHEVKHGRLSELPGDFPMAELSGEDVGRSDSGEIQKSGK